MYAISDSAIRSNPMAARMDSRVDSTRYKERLEDLLRSGESHERAARRLMAEGAPPMDLGTIEGRARYTRILRGLGVNQIGQMEELGGGFTSRLENGQKAGVTAAKLVRLAQVLDVDAGWLLTGRGIWPLPDAANSLDAAVALLAQYTDARLEEISLAREEADPKGLSPNAPVIEWLRLLSTEICRLRQSTPPKGPPPSPQAIRDTADARARGAVGRLPPKPKR